jgi:hypothetical protein
MKGVVGVETQPMSSLDVGKWRIERKENFMAIRASLRLTLCTVASLFVSGVAFAQETGTTTGPAAENTSNRAPLLKKGMKATNSAARAARSAAAEPVLRRCPGPKAEQLPPRENKRYIAVIKTVSERRGNKFTNDIGYS